MMLEIWMGAGLQAMLATFWGWMTTKGYSSLPLHAPRIAMLECCWLGRRDKGADYQPACPSIRAFSRSYRATPAGPIPLASTKSGPIGGLRCLAASWNQPFPTFLAHFLPFLPFSGGAEKHLGNPENTGKTLAPQVSSNLLIPPSLKPPFATLQSK